MVAFELRLPYIREKQIEVLRGISDLTMTFDGLNSRQDSIYTAHATTPDRKTYLLDGHMGSLESHTTEWVKEKILTTARNVGEENWAAVCSDSTAVTKASRREFVKEIPTVLDLCDACHHIHNTIKDITALKDFKWMITTLSKAINHFSKSTHARAALRKHLNETSADEKIGALSKIGKTRFATHWSAANSMRQCLPAIRELVLQRAIKFNDKAVQKVFEERISLDYHQFELLLHQYVAIVEPMARSLWSLEAASANASDVYVFWLAMAASLRDLFTDEKRKRAGIPTSLATSITDIFNARFDEFFRNDIYFTGFALDPRYPRADILLVSPAAPPTITLPTPNADLTVPHPRAFSRVKEMLKKILRAQIERMDSHPNEAAHPVLQRLGPQKAAETFASQFEVYWRQKWPFEGGPDNGLDTYSWWKKLSKNPHAEVLAMLAMKVFAVVVNSMADERTGSKVSWLNGPLRGRQLAQTLMDMAVLGMWYGEHQPSVKAPKRKQRRRPAVKFRDIDADLMRAIISPNQDGAENNGAESESDEEADSFVSDDDEEFPTRFTRAIADAAEEGSGKSKIPPLLPSEDVNLESVALCDLLSDGPLLEAQAVQPPADEPVVPSKPGMIDWSKI